MTGSRNSDRAPPGIATFTRPRAESARPRLQVIRGRCDYSRELLRPDYYGLTSRRGSRGGEEGGREGGGRGGGAEGRSSAELITIVCSISARALSRAENNRHDSSGNRSAPSRVLVATSPSPPPPYVLLQPLLDRLTRIAS